MKNAIATINTDAGIMVIYYNGANEYLTAETADVIETIEDARPESLETAVELVSKLYISTVWDLRFLNDDSLYTIKDAFLEAWGVMGDETTVSGSEIVRLATEWGMSIAELMEQVEA